MRAKVIPQRQKRLETGTKRTGRWSAVREVSHDYTVYVDNRENYIAQARTFSRDNALKVANALSVQFPDFPITVEEWKFVFSSEFLDSGLFKGEVINFPAINRKEVAWCLFIIALCSHADSTIHILLICAYVTSLIFVVTENTTLTCTTTSPTTMLISFSSP